MSESESGCLENCSESSAWHAHTWATGPYARCIPLFGKRRNEPGQPGGAGWVATRECGKWGAGGQLLGQTTLQPQSWR